MVLLFWGFLFVFYHEHSKAPEQAAQRFVESPSMDRVKIHLEEPAMADFFEQKVGLGTSSSPLQPQLFCVSLKTIIMM